MSTFFDISEIHCLVGSNPKRAMIPNPTNIIHCAPQDIMTFHGITEHFEEIKQHWHTGCFTLDGNWDSGSNIHTSGFETALRYHLQGNDHTDTLHWQRRVEAEGIARTALKWESSLKMYHDICQNGYHVIPLPGKLDEYITVCIARDGRIGFFNGLHRLACLKLSGKKAEPIPVKVVCRHKKWHQLREDLLRRGTIYAQLPHSDLRAIPHHWGLERPKAIALRLCPGNTVLDAGAHHGAISSVLASAGMVVTAVEIGINQKKILSQIAQLHDASFKTRIGSMLDVTENFDVLVILNLIHHFLKTTDTFPQFLGWLDKHSFRRIYYQGHGTIRNTFRVKLTQEECRDKIMAASRLTEWEELPIPSNQNGIGRKLYEIK